MIVNYWARKSSFKRETLANNVIKKLKNFNAPGSWARSTRDLMRCMGLEATYDRISAPNRTSIKTLIKQRVSCMSNNVNTGVIGNSQKCETMYHELSKNVARGKPAKYHDIVCPNSARIITRFRSKNHLYFQHTTVAHMY